MSERGLQCQRGNEATDMSQAESLSPFLTWEYVPELRHARVVIGFHGWSDAGNVSSDTLEYLKETLQPRVFATLTQEPFINYTLDRPVGQIQDGLISHLEPMVTEFSCWSKPEEPNDLVLVLGKEPHFNWRLYSQIVMSALRHLSVKRFYTIGGVQDTITHLAPPYISTVGSSAEVVAEVVALEEGIEPADYAGPVSIHSFLLWSSMESGIEAVSLWGHAPPYLQKNPRIVAKLVSILNNATGMQCPIDLLTRKSVELDRRINDILSKDPNLKQFVQSIEGKKRGHPTASYGDKIIRLDDFLRRDSDNDSKK
jgi:proteasome assembly chaperone (PAC2) family protein